MFLLLLIGLPVLEVIVFVEVALAIGWLWALLLLLATSVLGVRVARHQGRSAIEEVSRALVERRPPGTPALDGALGSIGGLLLMIPGFVTDALGVFLLLPPARRLTRRWISSHYGARAVRYAASAGRFASGGPRRGPADVESTAFEEDIEQLPR
jgi:UPF0716 protein FxsA